MQFNNISARTQNLRRKTSEATSERILRLREMFKQARTTKEKQAVAAMLMKKTAPPL